MWRSLPRTKRSKTEKQNEYNIYKEIKMKDIDLSHNNLLFPRYNKSTRIFVVIIGIITGFGGIGHGVFETLQGNRPTEDILERIGAFTIFPNYLLTGIASIIISLFIIFWTIGFIHKKHGPIIYLLLSISLFLVGGGIAMILGFLLTWAVATQINKPLTWWRKVLPEKLNNALAKGWMAIMITGFLFLSIGIGIWLMLTPPGDIYQINIVDYICWSFLCLGLIFLILTIVSGFARDIEISKTLNNLETKSNG